MDAAALGHCTILQNTAITVLQQCKYLDGAFQISIYIVIHLSVKFQLHWFPATALFDLHHSFSKTKVVSGLQRWSWRQHFTNFNGENFMFATNDVQIMYWSGHVSHGRGSWTKNKWSTRFVLYQRRFARWTSWALYKTYLLMMQQNHNVFRGCGRATRSSINLTDQIYC